MTLSTDQERTIIENAQRFAATVRLESEEEFYTAVQSQLGQLTGHNMSKRRNTIIALGEAAVNPEITRASIFKRKNCISEPVFYDRQKDWFQSPNFRTALENIIALYRKWEAIKQLKEVEERQAKWREDSYNIGINMAAVARNMLGQDLYEVVFEDDEGRQVTAVPAKWAFRDAATLATAADKLVRLSLDMATEKTEVDIDADIHEAARPRETLKQKLARLREGMVVGTAVADDQEEDDEAV